MGEPARPLPAVAGVALDEQPDHVGDVLVGSRQPILQREKIDAHVLRRAGHEAQELGQLAQHRHLALAARLLARAAAPEPLQPGDGTQRLRAHVEFADAREAHDLGRGQAAHDGVAGLPPCEELRQHGLNVILQEEHRADDDVGRGDVGVAAGQEGGIAAPFVGGMDGQGQAIKFPAEARFGARDGRGQVTVHRHHHDPDGVALSGRNALWHRKGSRW